MAATRSYRSPRRERDAAETRRDIFVAARELFAARGYGRVTVADIAHRADIAVKTVYASAGTKADILSELLAIGIAGSGAKETLTEVQETTDLESAMRVLARGTRAGNEANRETVEIMFSAMGSNDAADDIWEQATTAYRQVLREVAEHVAEQGGLAPGLGVDRAADQLWFCFGISAWRTLVKDCGWSYDEAEQWLGGRAVEILGGRP